LSGPREAPRTPREDAKLDGISLRFWGVRGSIACPGSEYSRYGGNTPCLEIRCGPHILVFDGGTGIRPLGWALKKEEPLDFDLFFSHSHFDHIVGLPFFKPLFHAENRCQMWAGHLLPERTLRDVLCVMMHEPLFPVPIDTFSAATDYHDFRAGDTLSPRDGITLRTAPLNHPNRATGYRVEYEGRSVCYVTDTEHQNGRLDENVLGLVKDSDVFIYDATYTDSEYPKYQGWGHSTWQQGMRLADAANVRTYVLFHHDPGHDDGFLDRIAEEVEAARPGSIVAREGMILRP
jgi:phosphoribosyl 1,2-cyclic phosphodiesterase